METKHDKFVRLAEYRTNEILNRIKILGNCANRSVYDFSLEEINRIFSEIEKNLRETKSMFSFKKGSKFKF